MSNTRNWVCLLLTMFFCNNLFAQQNQATAPGSFKLFFEKVYLHLDRDYYASGDNIWFKAYLVNAKSNYITNTSNNLYVELITPLNKVLVREVIRMDNGLGTGDFSLPDTIPGGVYLVRAYTNWMRNFGSHFIFEKEIRIQGLVGNDVKNAETIASSPVPRQKAAHAAYKIQFLPEGGTMTEDVSTVVAFKAVDGSDKGVMAKGVIISSKGDTAATFTTVFDGMGSFPFKPEAGLTYRAMVQFNNSGYVTTEFPQAFPDGFVMNVTGSDMDNISVRVSTNKHTAAIHASGEITLVCRHAGTLCYSNKFILKEGTADLIIPKKDLPAGLTSITMYDEKLHPYCERLLYIEKNTPLFITVTTARKVYLPKEKVSVDISVTDAQQQPVKAMLSLSAVDEGIVKSSPLNITSYLMLQSELKGSIENSAQYFDPSNSHRNEQLDLLLITQGWRSFLWRQIADTSFVISYLPEPGITISGKVKRTLGNKPLQNMNITLYVPGAKGNKTYLTKTDSSGNYYLDGLNFYGDQTIRINAKNNKGEKQGMIVMDKLYDSPLPVFEKLPAAPDTSESMKRFENETAKRHAIIKNDTFTHQYLPTVTVTNERKVVTSRDGQAYMKFGYPEYNYAITSKDYQYETLVNFLIHNVPGAVADVESEGINFVANGRLVRPRFVVDKKEDVFERIDYYNVHMDQVNNVSVRHYVGPPTFAVLQPTARLDPGVSISDVFVILLTLKPGAYNNDLATINSNVNGYYESRIFYAPAYTDPDDRLKPDVRTTIYWEPFIETDNKGKAKLSFYNADPKTNIRISVEGLTPAGIPITSATSYQVR